MKRYSERTFNRYVDLAVRSAMAVASRDGRHLNRLVEKETRRSMTLSVAAVVFLSDESARPVHLERLLRKLRDFEVPEEQAAELCLSIEAVRIYSGRTASSPLLDPMAKAGPVQKAMRHGIADAAGPFVADWIAVPERGFDFI